MIDLHSHVLPNIDDGATSVMEAQQMLEVLYHDQINQVVCTPHFDPAKEALEDFIKKRSNALVQIKHPKVTLIAGSETMLHDYLFYYPDIQPLSIGNTRYILIELSYDRTWGKEVFQRLDKLIHNYHVIPVLAHIERYDAAKKRHIITKLKKSGCLLQCNAGSVIDRKSSKRVLKLLKKGYIDVVASDCHNMSKRSPNLAQAYQIIQRDLGSDCCNRLKRNAELIIKDGTLREKTVLIVD